MPSLIKAALESFDEQNTSNPEKQTITMQGPLAVIYQKALDVVYGKKDDDPEISTGNAVMETQAMDAAINAAKEMQDALDQTMIYGVQQNNVTAEDVVNVSTDLSDPERRDSYILVVDSNVHGGEGENAEGCEQHRRALEAVTAAYDRPIFSSLCAALESLKKKK